MNKTTFMAKPGQVERKWYVVDATDVPLGRLSAVVASVLRGKNKPTFTPHTDTGDFVIVINAEKVKLTGKKATDKIYYTHSMYPGGLKQISAGELRSRNAVRLIEKSVKGMLLSLLDKSFDIKYFWFLCSMCVLVTNEDFQFHTLCTSKSVVWKHLLNGTSTIHRYWSS